MKDVMNCWGNPFTVAGEKNICINLTLYWFKLNKLAYKEQLIKYFWTEQEKVEEVL